MPKSIENSNKVPDFVTSDNSIVSLKSETQPLTKEEKVMINKIYNESIMRLKRTIALLNQLKTYLLHLDNKDARQNIKQLLVDKNTDPNVLHTLKMLKRHFYVNITNDTIQNVLRHLDPIKDNLFKTYKGLQGQLDISLEIFQDAPTPQDISQFKDKTYTLIRSGNNWSISYYENGIKKSDIAINDVDPGIQRLPSVDAAQLNRFLLLRNLMLYHAKHVKSFTNKVYISNISQKKQNDPHNKTLGYVYARQLGSNEYFGAIHIDYRLLHTRSFQALRTFIHESCHRFGWVNDRGYYHQKKAIKNTNQFRPYPKDVQADTMKATNNADSYSYFVCDMTGPDGLYSSENLPAWYNMAKDKPLPSEKQDKRISSESSDESGLLKYSLFTAGATALVLGGICLVSTIRANVR